MVLSLTTPSRRGRELGFISGAWHGDYGKSQDLLASCTRVS